MMVHGEGDIVELEDLASLPADTTVSNLGDGTWQIDYIPETKASKLYDELVTRYIDEYWEGLSWTEMLSKIAEYVTENYV